MKRTIKYCLAGATSLITLAAYLPSLRNGFVEWDDSAYVFDNPHIRSLEPSFFKWAFFDFYAPAGNWHPLTWISHALDYAIWGLDPMGHHLTNNILHATNTFLVVLLVVRLIESSRQNAVGGKHLPIGQVAGGAANNSTTQQLNSSVPMSHYSRFALIAAGVTGLLFGLHPIHVESVAWVAERKDVLCALFYLLSILSYIRYAAGMSQRDGGFSLFTQGAMLSALCFFVLALMSKPMAVSLPLVLLLLDWYPLQRIRSSASFVKALTEKLPFIALGLISSILTILAQQTGDAILSLEAVPLPTRALVAVKSLAAYLFKMILPLNLVPFYQYPHNVSFFSLDFFPAIVLVTGMTAACISLAGKGRKMWPAVWAYYVVTLAPVLGIVQVGSQAMADRYAYLPSIGPFLIAGVAASWLTVKTDTKKKDRLRAWIFGPAALLVLLVPMAYLTIKQIGVWENSITLWNYIIDREPQTYFAYNNRGLTYYAEGRLDAAMEDYNKAIALYPGYLKGHYNLGLVLYEKGFLDQAIGEYQTAVRLDPGYVNAHLNLGVAYSKKGLTDKATEEYRIVERLSQGSADPFYQLGAFFTRRGLLDEAMEQLQIALSIKPDFADAHNQLAAALFKKGRTAAALEHYLVVARLRPGDAAGYLNLGSAYAALGFLDKAIEQFQYAVRLNPDYVDAHYNLGMAYQAKGLMAQAVEHLETAARLSPGDAVIRNEHARAYKAGISPAGTGRMPDAK